jgi:tetratricopeptide (TPR) repeat protein
VAVTAPNPVAFNSLGVALAEQGQPGAIAWFNQDPALSPDDERCHQNLALALIDLRRFDDSLEQFQRVLRINPGLLSSQAHRPAKI